MTTVVLDAPELLRPAPAFTPQDLPEHFAARIVLRHVSVEDVDGPCWVWTGLANDRGYGQVKVFSLLVTVHRAAYELLVATIPAGLELGHLCLVRACCNPAHLSPATQVENNRRRKAAAGTVCRKGHPQLLENELALGYDADGAAVKVTCRACVQSAPRGQGPEGRVEPAAATAALVLAWT